MPVFNQGDSRQKIQACSECGAPTERCEEDSFFVGKDGPLCEVDFVRLSKVLTESNKEKV